MAKKKAIKKVVKPRGKRGPYKKTLDKKQTPPKKDVVKKEEAYLVEKETKVKEYPDMESVKKDIESGVIKEGDPWEIKETREESIDESNKRKEKEAFDSVIEDYKNGDIKDGDSWQLNKEELIAKKALPEEELHNIEREERLKRGD